MNKIKKQIKRMINYSDIHMVEVRVQEVFHQGKEVKELEDLLMDMVKEEVLNIILKVCSFNQFFI